MLYPQQQHKTRLSCSISNLPKVSCLSATARKVGFPTPSVTACSINNSPKSRLHAPSATAQKVGFHAPSATAQKSAFCAPSSATSKKSAYTLYQQQPKTRLSCSISNSPKSAFMLRHQAPPKSRLSRSIVSHLR